MKKKFGDRKRVTVYLDSEEYEWIVGQVVEGKVSEFVRDLVRKEMSPVAGNGSVEVAHQMIRGLTKQREPVKAEVSEYREIYNYGTFEKPKTIPGKTCRHGKGKGYNCGLCGGMARVE